MLRPSLLLIAGLLTLSPALSNPSANQPPGSTPCQVVADGPAAIAALKASVPEKRGRPIPNHLTDEPCRLTVQAPPVLRGTYQFYVQWIDYFIPGKTDEQRLAKATIWLTPSESSTPALLDIITCPMMTLTHPVRLVAPAEFSLRITDDYELADGSFERRPSRAEARWRFATQ